MDAVVIGTIISLVGTLIVIGYLAYKIIRLVNSDEGE